MGVAPLLVALLIRHEFFSSNCSNKGLFGSAMVGTLFLGTLESQWPIGFFGGSKEIYV
jgi:hypothetical protein